MRAQASLEYLLLSAVAISLLSVSVFALMSIKDGSEKSFAAFRFRSSSLALSNAINELCALGSGNGREVGLDADLSVEPVKAGEGWVVRFSDDAGGLSLVRKSRCDVDAADALGGTVYAENIGGVIVITERATTP